MLLIPSDSIPSFDELHKRHLGRWRDVLANLGVDSARLNGKAGPCPGCGGKDRFTFDDKHGRGTWYCHQGKYTAEDAYGDAFELLVHAGRARDKNEARKLVSGLDKIPSTIKPTVTSKTEFHYQNADGSLVLIVQRIEQSDGTKKFFQKTANGVSPKQDETFKYVPYNLPALTSNTEATIYIVEGEKCADTLINLGLVATCNAGGATNWQSELNQYFMGRNVVMLPDNDEKGEAHFEKVRNELAGVVASFKVCRLPGLKEKEDVVDWLRSGHGLKELSAELDAAKTVRTGFGMTLQELKSLNIIIPDPVHEHIPHGFTLLAGAPKAGKSTFMEWIASEVGSQRGPVLYLALEYSLPMLDARFSWMADCVDILLFHEGKFPSMDNGGYQQLKNLLSKYNPALTVIDTLARVKRPIAERGYDGETQAMSELKELFAEFNSSCVVIHHTRKASMLDNADEPFERILGSTALSAVPDNIMVLLQDNNQAVLHTKGRLVPANIKRFSLHGHVFECDDSAGAEIRGGSYRQADILDALQGGPLTQRELADETGIDPGNLSRMCRSLEAEKKITRETRGKPWNLVEKDLF